MEEKINLFIVAIVGISRDLDRWKNAEETPTEQQIENEWSYLKKLLEVAQEQKIDTSLLVCQHAQNCVASFIEYAPKVALVATPD